MAFRRCPGYPPYRLRILRFLLGGCTSRRFCEAGVHFFNVWRMASLPIESNAGFLFQKTGRPARMPSWGRAAGHPDGMCPGTPIHFPQCGARIWADIVTDNILYPILDVRLGDVGYGSRTDSIAVGKLGMGKPRPLVFIQPKQYLATLQYSFTGLFITGRFLECSPSSLSLMIYVLGPAIVATAVSF